MQRKPLSKSAPARDTQSGFKQSDSLREVRMWIESGREEDAPRREVAGRASGRLTENVTEERMLLARQMELGRERYKFLSNHTYEKQKFLDRQARKQKSMTVQMQRAKKEIEKLSTPRRSITVVMPRIDDVTPCHSDVEEMGRNPETRDNRKPPRAESRGSRISRLSRACSNRSPDGKPTNLLKREKTRMTNRNCYINSSSSGKRKTVTETRISCVPSTVNQRKVEPKRVPSARIGIPGPRTVLPFGRQTQTNAVHSAEQSERRLGSSPIVNETVTPDNVYAKKWAVKTNKGYAASAQYGSRFQSSVSDPRYLALTRSLIPHESLPKPKLRVEDIISSKDLLNKKGSKCEQNTQRRLMHANFIAYILAELNLK